MLVLSRKVGEEIVIDGEIRVSIVRVRGNRVRLGIQAPADVSIRRQDTPPPPDKAASNAQAPLCSPTTARP
ncbi:MAG TPA: carbon storage regulator [Planctomycetaceae bacterium]|jgi:carbon storage regulator|nr:carbon storage regulator [Planctomycetaceae bacterium]